MRTVAIVIAAMLSGASASAYATCGDRGGPGYRGPDGKCVGWARLGSTCGSPPTTGCTPEHVRTGASSAAKLGEEIEKLRRRQPINE